MGARIAALEKPTSFTTRNLIGKAVAPLRCAAVSREASALDLRTTAGAPGTGTTTGAATTRARSSTPTLRLASGCVCEREQQVHGLDRDQQQRVLPEDQRRGHAERCGRAGQRLLLPQLRGPAEPPEQRWAQLRGPDPSAERRVLQGEVPGFRGPMQGLDCDQQR